MSAFHLPALLVLIIFYVFTLPVAGAFYCKVDFELSFHGQLPHVLQFWLRWCLFLSLIQRRRAFGSKYLVGKEVMGDLNELLLSFDKLV